MNQETQELDRMLQQRREALQGEKRAHAKWMAEPERKALKEAYDNALQALNDVNEAISAALEQRRNEGFELSKPVRQQRIGAI